MSAPTPHYLLFSEAHARSESAAEWRFVLESVDGRSRIAAADLEPESQGERLELLAVVRGLEALEQPSRVTLVTRSRYVSRGLERGLAEWRENEWRWERFGRRVSIRDADLWQRIDRAMGYHKIECRTWRFDSAHAERPDENPSSEVAERRVRTPLLESDDAGVLPDVLIVRNRPRHSRGRRHVLASVSALLRHMRPVPTIALTR